MSKVVEAHKRQDVEKTWTVYENSFTKVDEVREFYIIREMQDWSKMEDIMSEEAIGKVLSDAFGESQGAQILATGQRVIIANDIKRKGSVNNLSHFHLDGVPQAEC